jgi:hypothetical protein
MKARRPFKPAVALLLTALALALPAAAMARFDEYPVHPVHLHVLAPAAASARLTARPAGHSFDWSDAGIGAASAVLASALALSGARALARRRGVRRSHPATGG